MKDEKLRKQELVKNVIEDFETRKAARKAFELQWQLNIDFLRGNQNSKITSFDTVANASKQFYWQQHEVFNHINPLVEARLAKLTESNEKTEAIVVPLSNDANDVRCAEVCEKVVKSAFRKVNIESLVDQGNLWSEMTGTAFYKVIWDNNGGRLIGEHDAKKLYEGDVKVVVCGPFEIYPDSLTASDINEVRSLIHAKPYTVEAIREIWGVDVAGGDVDVFDFNRTTRYGATVLKNATMVIERYRNGRLTIVAGDYLLFDGEYDRLPFIRQTSESMPGSFFGKSIIERVIPVQKAYNSVKNRKTEFLNRLACGVVAVEDGSIDIEALENDGLAPGSVIVYRQGSTPPTFMEGGSLPSELEREEDRLLREFEIIAGGSDVARSGDWGAMSGIALEIMVEQAKLRMRRSIVSSRLAVARIASHILGLYKKYACEARLERLVLGKEVHMFTWCADDITSEEVVINE